MASKFAPKKPTNVGFIICGSLACELLSGSRVAGSMENEDRRDEYFAKARQALEQAERYKDLPTREAWLRLSATYRELALAPEYFARKEKAGSAP